MRLRMLALLTGILVAPAAAPAQSNWPCCKAVTKPQLEQLLPLIQNETLARSGFDDRLAQRGMSKGDYVALKSSLQTAKLDAADGARLNALPFDDGSRAARKENVALYRANKARIDAALAGARVETDCRTCTLIPSRPAPRR